MPVNPSVQYVPAGSLSAAGPIQPYPSSGNQMVVRLVSGLNSWVLFASGGGWTDAGSPQTTSYAFTPPTGVKTKSLHALGTLDIGWAFQGDLTLTDGSLVGFFLDPVNRGVRFDTITVQQGTNTTVLNDCYWSSFGLNASSGGNISFSISGKTTQVPVAGIPIVASVSSPLPLPAWSSGNVLVESWSLAHNVTLTPFYPNSASPLADYYRPGESSIDMSMTTLLEARDHFSIDIGLGTVVMISAVVTNREGSFGGRLDPVSYQLGITNCRYVTSSTGTGAPAGTDETGLVNLFFVEDDVRFQQGQGRPPIPGVTGRWVDSPGIDPASQSDFHPSNSDVFQPAITYTPAQVLPDAWPDGLVP